MGGYGILPLSSFVVREAIPESADLMI